MNKSVCIFDLGFRTITQKKVQTFVSKHLEFLQKLGEVAIMQRVWPKIASSAPSLCAWLIVWCDLVALWNVCFLPVWSSLYLAIRLWANSSKTYWDFFRGFTCGSKFHTCPYLFKKRLKIELFRLFSKNVSFGFARHHFNWKTL